jgi:tRNA dimethylallyltransferase
MQNKPNSSKACLIITGPTGVGKSDLSLELARVLNGEIINGDVGQFYTPLSIGTAKPDWRNLPIPHHLFDIINTPRNYTVTEYREQVEKIITEIQARGKTPIVVGGSMFYLQSLLFYIESEKPQKGIKTDFTLYSLPELWNQLLALDPERARAIHPNDRYRLERALQLWENSGELPSLQKPVFKPVCENFFVMNVVREREDLYARINARTGVMIAHGWLQEVGALTPDWRQFLLTKGMIGYPEIIGYLERGGSCENLVATIAQETRRYAKRQLTFWRMLQKKIEAERPGATAALNLTFLDVDLYIRSILSEGLLTQ